MSHTYTYVSSLSIHISNQRPTDVPIWLSIFRAFGVSVFLPACLCLYLSIYLSIYTPSLSICYVLLKVHEFNHYSEILHTPEHDCVHVCLKTRFRVCMYVRKYECMYACMHAYATRTLLIGVLYRVPQFLWVANDSGARLEALRPRFV